MTKVALFKLLHSPCISNKLSALIVKVDVAYVYQGILLIWGIINQYYTDT